VGGGADGFQVNPDALMQLGQSLIDLKGEFDRGVGGLDQLIGALGHDGLREKVREFSDNWSDKRALISGQLEQAAGFAKQAADVYRTTDEEMRKQLQPQAAPAERMGPPSAPPTTRPAPPPPFVQPAKPSPAPAPPLPTLHPPTTRRGGR
jgi:hypothetical protein